MSLKHGGKRDGSAIFVGLILVALVWAYLVWAKLHQERDEGWRLLPASVWRSR